MIDPSIRASDADRDAVTKSLREHLVAGRITLEEFEHRLDLVLSAVTLGDLSPITSDLPRAPAQAPFRAWLRQSGWVLLTLPLGFTTWAAFLYAGLRAKKSDLLLASAAYGVALVLYLVLVGISPERSAVATVGAIVGIIAWLIGIVHTLIIRQSVAERLSC